MEMATPLYDIIKDIFGLFFNDFMDVIGITILGITFKSKE